MSRQVEGTPHRLVVEDVEVRIEDIVVDQFYLYFVLVMCKRAEISVLAVCDLVRVLGTELALVLVLSVQLLDGVVGILALIPLNTVSLSVNGILLD